MPSFGAKKLVEEKTEVIEVVKEIIVKEDKPKLSVNIFKEQPETKSKVEEEKKKEEVKPEKSEEKPESKIKSTVKIEKAPEVPKPEKELVTEPIVELLSEVKKESSPVKNANPFFSGSSVANPFLTSSNNNSGKPNPFQNSSTDNNEQKKASPFAFKAAENNKVGEQEPPKKIVPPFAFKATENKEQEPPKKIVFSNNSHNASKVSPFAANNTSLTTNHFNNKNSSFDPKPAGQKLNFSFNQPAK